MDLSRLSDGDIQEAIRKMQKGIEIKPGSVEATELQTSIDRALEELQRRGQKKSDSQPTGKTGELEQPNRVRPELNPSLGIPSLNKAPEKLEADREQQIERENKAAWYEERKQVASQPEAERAIENKGWEQVKKVLATAPTVAPKPTSTIHFAGQPMPGQYTRGELWSDVRQNFKLVLLSATFRRCLGRGDYSELWSMVLFVKLWQGIHEGLKKLEGGKDYTMEELLIRHWAYGEDMKEAGRVLAEFLKQPKPE